MEKTYFKDHQLQFSQKDAAVVDEYRKLKDTSVLTIMFTDIKGFTSLTEEKGEVYSNKIRKMHDEILVSTIEQNEAGKVIKYIGDSVMAIFSEPSAAVDRALKIQERIRDFNKEHHDIEDIKIRIGLHMGQVTTEDKVNLDVFGRHVNRASRVKELADGEQIYLSYPVFDSAKGWLIGKKDKNIVWKLHGRYFVKGIKEALEIYEVADVDYNRPKPPIKARKKRNVPKLVTSIVLVLCGIVGVLAVLQFKKTSVVFVKLGTSKLVLNRQTKLMITGERGQEMRTSLTRIPPGDHLIHYDVSYVTRYYADITVKRGKNLIQPKFKYNGMPGLSRHITFSEDGKNKRDISRTYKYFVYDKENNKKENTVIIHFIIQIKKDPSVTDKFIFDYNWDVTLNGKEISREHMTETNLISNKDTKRMKEIIYEDDYHYYFAKYYIAYASTELSIGAAFIEYK